MEIMEELLSTVPVASAALGSVAGLARPGSSSPFFGHAEEDSPALCGRASVVEAAFGRKVEKEELGGSRIHTTGFGAVDNEVASEEEALSRSGVSSPTCRIRSMSCPR